MYAVGKLGSYISRGVSTVSSPFQPYGGAVDIIVVEQPDGTFKSCPWYVRFGKSQGVLKPSEKVVSINVNDADADFHMYLDNNGDAYFLREVDGEDGEWESYTCSSGDEKNLSSGIRRIQKSKSCDYDANRVDLVSEFEASDGNMLDGTAGRRGRLFGLSFGKRSIKEGDSQEDEGASRANRATSMERAEMAADLLEVRWTTNIETGKKCNGNLPQVPKPKLPVPGVVRKVGVEDVPNTENCLINENKLDSSLSNDVNGASCAPGCKQASNNKEVDAEIPCSVNPRDSVEINTMEETRVGVDLVSNGSEISYGVDNITIYKDRNAQCNLLGVECSVQSNRGGTKIVESSISRAMDECSGHSNGGVLVSAELLKVPKDQLLMKRISSEPVCTVLTREIDTQDNQNPCPGVLPRQGVDTKEGAVENIASCNGEDKTLGNITESENSEEEQFSLSDLGDREIEKVNHVGALLPDDRKKCVPGDFSKSSEEVTERMITGESHQATDKLNQDDQVIIRSSPKFKPKGISSPISIPKHHNGAEEKFITPVAESLPSMLLTGNQHGLCQPLSRSLDSNFEAMKIVNNDAPVYPETIAEQQVPSMLNNSQISEEIKSIVSDPAIEISLCRHLLCEGMGYEAAALAFDAEKLDKYKFASGCPGIVKDDKLVVRIGGLYFPWDAALPIASAIGSQGREQVLEAKGMIPVGQADKTFEGTPQNNNMDPRNGSWKLWPFSFIKKTSSVKDTSVACEPASENRTGKNKNVGKDEIMGKDGGARKDGNTEKDRSTGDDGSKAKEGNSEKDGSTEQEGSMKMGGSTDQNGNTEKCGNTDVSESKVTKKKIRAKIPTSEQLTSLNLKKGKNVVTFSFTTELQGKQQVDARIFLWKWDTRIVISDVDGTITKSDVLGHVMPLMGMDWSHTGVTHLFSAIKENGYQLLFLSARSILQASTTRQFLISLKQDGKALPEGPIVISPDGLFPSLYREVIRRAPHEFKISCLEDIKALFPRDHNPFYAGFGNRETDELSYLKVGIPKGKIFTINPKGEVVVNRRVDAKSYTSLHALVHDMFPETPVIEQEDYNQWNFWRLPPPDVI